MNEKGSSRITEANPPIRAEPLPLEFPGLHDLDDQEIETVVRVLKRRSPFRYYSIDSPGEVSAFESEFADFLGIALAVNSGTATLRVALSAFGVGPGQEVIVPAYMWASVADAVVNLGAIPVLADIDNLLCGP